MTFKEISVYTTSEAADLVADAFFSEGGSGVSISDKKDIVELLKSHAAWDYVDDKLLDMPDGVAIVKGYAPIGSWQEQLERVQEAFNKMKENSGGGLNFGSLEIVTRDIDDSKWRDAWKNHFRPIHIGEIVICPKWIELEAKGKAKVLIDPGMVFGTGEHETTAMCIELMQDFDLAGKTVFDIGCGSGILGVCALKLGAQKAYFMDIDSLALEASANCVHLNGVEDKANISRELPHISCDLALMNIVAEVLIGYRDKVCARLKKGGAIILSGIIEGKLVGVTDAYEEAWFEKIRVLRKGEWFALSMRKQYG
jgi:ribosomal protein L11 methyltransferase